MIERLTSRKFLFALFSLLLAFGLVVTSKIEAKEFMDFMGFVGSMYVLGNVGETVAQRIK